jgi:hypothetical protein
VAEWVTTVSEDGGKKKKRKKERQKCIRKDTFCLKEDEKTASK